MKQAYHPLAMCSGVLYYISCFLQGFFEVEGRPVPNKMIFTDEAGFNLTRQEEGGGTQLANGPSCMSLANEEGMCAAISNQGVLHCHATPGHITQHFSLLSLIVCETI